EYSIRPDGKIKVVNRGYNTKKEKWEDAVGKARFVGNERVGQLQVSFFGPFYAGYNVLAIDENYQYALVGGDDFKYLWLLSRQKTMPEAVKNEYVEKAKNLGYHAEDLIWVEQDK
ncbi:MAG: lipocalin family protein, partial [Saprospiraceae bacterium]|nr:lipocalin family protein [Saprospiraceae bacterium]